VLPLQFAVVRHWAQIPAAVLHSGVFGVAVQSGFVRHVLRQVREVASHTGVTAGQSLAVRQPTHCLRRVSHLPFWHWALSRQPTQVAVATSHTGVLPPHSLLVVHPVHWAGLPRQKGVAAGQLALLRHPPHRPCAQTAFAPGQSEFFRQVTQVLSVVLQTGVVPEQLVLVRHCSHRLDTHTGLAVGQSTAPAHCTHWLVNRLQIGFPAAQLVLPRHSTQRWVLVLHAGVLPPHCALLAHCTHRPLGTSQIVAWGFRHWVLVVQGATQVEVRGSQVGVAPPQLTEVRQVTQRLVVTSHSGVAPPHSELAVHWTHLFAAQTGEAVGQSEFPLHCAHWPVGVQTRPPPQSGDVRQLTHANADEQ
jgi:hypothetical protein